MFLTLSVNAAAMSSTRTHAIALAMYNVWRSFCGVFFAGCNGVGNKSDVCGVVYQKWIADLVLGCGSEVSQKCGANLVLRCGTVVVSQKCVASLVIGCAVEVHDPLTKDETAKSWSRSMSLSKSEAECCPLPVGCCCSGQCSLARYPKLFGVKGMLKIDFIQHN